jgi:hypothetical protein
VLSAQPCLKQPFASTFYIKPPSLGGDYPNLTVLLPLGFVVGMEDRFTADLTDFPMNAGTMLVVPALADDVERTKLGLGIGDRHLGRRVGVHHRPALVAPLELLLRQFRNLGPI